MRSWWLLIIVLLCVPSAAFAGSSNYSVTEAGLVASAAPAAADLAPAGSWTQDPNTGEFWPKDAAAITDVQLKAAGQDTTPQTVYYEDDLVLGGYVVTTDASDTRVKLVGALTSARRFPLGQITPDMLALRVPLYLLVEREPKRELALIKTTALKALLPASEWSEADCKRRARVTAPGVGKTKDSSDNSPALVCIDLLNGVSTIYTPSGNVVAPNESLLVVVRHRADEEIVFELSGTRGSTQPMLGRATSADGGLKPAVAGPGGPVPLPLFSARSFGPRLAGSLLLTIKTKMGGVDAVVRTTVELEVDARYWGAVRFGVGTLFGDFRGYDTVMFAGSQTTQIRESRFPVQFELVTGFALYPQAFYGGRSYSKSGLQMRLSPFVGFGLVGQSAKDISALTSFHIGIDIEFARDLSLDATFVLKRTSELADGYRPGSPLEAGATADKYTVTGFRPGFALVISASPSFLQFADGTGKGGN